ncbi:glycosyltransferase family 2 protein [Deferribacterales bacterium RsTz2092]|nr:glycosyl transferase [Deferribacterales bacterium]
MNSPRLVIILPCYNEEAVLSATIQRLSAVLDALIVSGKVSADSELLFVDDGSTDGTWDIIAAAGDRVKGISLSTNKGHQIALIAGMTYAQGKCDCLVSIDADLQQDENAISEFIDKFNAGADIVLGVRNDRHTDSAFKRKTAEMFYDFMIAMGIKLTKNSADFRLLSARANDALLKYQENNLFLRGLVGDIGFKTDYVHFNVSAREAGNSKYNLRRMLSLALTGVLSFSVFPLRVISVLGILVSVVSVIMMFSLLYDALMDPGVVHGWASTVLPIFFFGGVQLLALGIIGEYVGKIYSETKRRPKYFVEREKQ